MRSGRRVLLGLGAMVLAVFMGAAMAVERGDVLGYLTIAGWGALFLAVIFEREALAKRPWLDRGVVPVFVFFTGLAALTSLPLAACAGLAVVVAAALWAWNARGGGPATA